MEAYSSFAQVYDTFMDNVCYDDWSKYLIGLLRKYGILDGIVLDMGCGTGNITERLAKENYNMIGIDNSEEMLNIAIKKRMELPTEKEENKILYLLQDMREFELYGTVAAVVSICDSINYIISEKELLKVFKLVNNYLDKQGVFIFDLNTEYKYDIILSDNVIAENREDVSFIWENYYDRAEKINEYNLTIYVKEGTKNSSLFRRYNEIHYQRAYSLETIKKLLEEAGMEFVATYDAFSEEKPKEDSERIYVIARERNQVGKFYTK